MENLLRAPIILNANLPKRLAWAFPAQRKIAMERSRLVGQKKAETFMAVLNTPIVNSPLGISLLEKPAQNARILSWLKSGKRTKTPLCSVLVVALRRLVLRLDLF